MAKEFKTIDQLIELMESRGIKTDDQTALAIRRESYYAIINGYKGPFLDREAMQSSSDDVYLPGTTFKQIYDLFIFDRHLRQLTFPFLTLAESTLKNAVVYAFCEKNRDAEAYLERSNYVSASNMLVPRAYQGNRIEEHATNMANLMRILNGKLTASPKKMRPFVRHYRNSYGKVPLWVLQNDLTFGNIAHFYQLQKRDVQNAACKIVSEGAQRRLRLNPHDLLRAFDVLVGFRNICAHDERLYCASVKGARFADMYRQLRLILPEDEANAMLEALNSLIREFNGRISHDVLIQVNQEMGVKIN